MVRLGDLEFGAISEVSVWVLGFRVWGLGF